MNALKLSCNVYNLARIGSPDILWTVNKFARAITKMDQSM